VPTTVAQVAARSATIAEFPAAASRSPSSISFAYQSVVNPRQVSDERESLNENAISTAIGRYRSR